MVAKNVIAKRYAKALFKAATATNSVDDVSADLIAIASTLKEDKQKLNALTSRVLPLEIKQRHWDAILKVKMNKITKNFIQVLIQNNRLDALIDCAYTFHDLVQKSKNIIPVKITTASAIPAKTIALIGKQIEQTVNSKIFIRTSENKNIIGGLIINIGNNILDMSIRTRLAQVKNYIKNVTA